MKCPKCDSENTADSRFCKNCATPLPVQADLPLGPTKTIQKPREELTTGSTFAGRYQIIEDLGQGGMGNVYKALDTEINEKVAIKLVRPDIAFDKHAIERFRNELKFARRIRHKNVCHMYDLSKDEETYYITMEYISGENLKSFIRKSKQLSVGTALSIAKQVCEGLAEAHKLGVVHRDLKPQNVMIDDSGNARIMDFGIARSLKEKGITGAGVMIGTPEYMSPEQVESKESDARADIYSLGIILYEMLTGKVPFEGDTPFAIGVKHKSEAPEEPRTFNPQISEYLSAAILKCLEKEKEKRYRTAGDLLSELETIEAGLPTTEIKVPEKKPFTSKEITLRFNTRKLVVPVAISIAVVIIGLLAWHSLSKKRTVPFPGSKPSLAVMYFKNNTGDESLDHWREMIADSLTSDLSQSKYIAVMSSEKLFQILSDMDKLDAQNYSSEVLKQVGIRGGVNHILVGNYAKAGETIRIHVTLQDMGSDRVSASESVEGKGVESIFTMVDELTRQIKKDLNLSADELADDLDLEASSITTSSPEAYKFYVEGRKYHLKGDFPRSIALMEKAIAIDPEFAMAYRSLGSSFANLGLEPQSQTYRKKALDLSGRLSEREAYLIRGDYYFHSESTFDKAIEAYKHVIEIYPEDTTARQNMGEIYYAQEQWDNAIQQYKRCTELKTEFIYSYTQLASSYSAKGLYETAGEVLEKTSRDFKENPLIFQELSAHYYLLKQFELAQKALDTAFALNPEDFMTQYHQGSIHLFQEKLSETELEFQRIVQDRQPIAQYMGRLSLYALNLLKGRFQEAKAQLNQGISLAKSIEVKWVESDMRLTLSYLNLYRGETGEALKKAEGAWNCSIAAERHDLQRFALYFKGRSVLMNNSIPESKKIAAELKEMIKASKNQNQVRLYHDLMGRIEMASKKYSEALEHFRIAVALLPNQHTTFSIDRFIEAQAFFIEPLANALYLAGDLDGASKEYESITSLTTGRMWYGDIYAKSFFMLGKIFKKKGMKEKAIANYQKFLDLWKDADPGIPEIDEARRSLAELRNLP